MSAYEEIGGAGSIKAAVAVFYQRVLDDPDLRGYFANTDLDRLRAHQRAFLSEALGGPHLFAGRSLDQAHAGLDVTDGAFDALVEHLVMTLHDLGLPEPSIRDVRAALEPLRSQVVSVQPAPVDC